MKPISEAFASPATASIKPGARRLERQLRPLDVLLLCLSALSPAASVYIAGGVVLRMAGTGTALAFILGGVIAFLQALLSAELGAAFPRAGGTYPGLGLTLGSAAGFVVLIVSLVVNPAVLGLAALGLADYVGSLVPALPRLPLVLGGLLLATVTALLNIRANAWITGVFLMLEMIALAILTGVAALHPARALPEVLRHPIAVDAAGVLQPVSAATIALAVVSANFVCAGASWAVYFGEELHDAKRRIGGVIAWAGLMAAVTIAVPLVLVVLAVPDPAMLGTAAPIATFLKSTAGPIPALLISGGVALAIFNNMIALALTNGRLIYSTARDGIWPRGANAALLRMHPRFKSPWVAVLVANLIAGAFCALGERTILVLVSGEVMTGLLLALAIYVGRRKTLTGFGDLFRTPLFPALPVLAVCFAGATIVADWLDIDAGRPSLVLLTVIDAAAFLYYAAVLRRRPGGWHTLPPADEAEPAPGD